MKSHLRFSLILLVFFGCFTFQSVAQEKTEKAGNVAQNDDEQDVKDSIVAFLTALGNNNMEVLPDMFMPDANIGSIRKKEGKTSVYTNSVEEWLAERAQKENKLFEEPVQKFSVEISQGMLAFVRADATIIHEGVPSHHTHDFFVLMKDEGKWKILSGSYTTLPLE